MRNKVYFSIVVRVFHGSRRLEMNVSAKKVEVENLVSMAKRIDLEHELTTPLRVVEVLAEWNEQMRAYGAERVRVRGKLNP